MIVEIHKGEVLSISEGTSPVKVRALTGKVWLTQDGSPADIVVLSGGEIELSTNGGKIVLEALGGSGARVKISA